MIQLDIFIYILTYQTKPVVYELDFLYLYINLLN